MDVKITPGYLSGDIEAIASKSHGHRLLLASVLTAAESGRTSAEDID